MADNLVKTNEISAKLHSIEEDTANFILNSSKDKHIISWPIANIPEGIEIGDEVKISIEFELEEERKELLKKKAANDMKFANMRKLLEELVN